MRYVLMRMLPLVALLTAAAGCATVPPRTDVQQQQIAPSPVYVEAQKYFLSRDFENAAKQFAASIAEHPRSPSVPEAHYWIGMCRLNQKRYADAEDAFRNCQAGKPSETLDLKAWTGIAIAYQHSAKYGAAAKIYERVLQSGNRYVERDLIAYNRGVCLLKSGDSAGGKAALQQVVRDYPQSQWAEAAKDILKPGAAGSAPKKR